MADAEDLPPTLTINDVGGLSEILGKDSQKLCAQSHFITFLIRKFSHKAASGSRSASRAEDLKSCSAFRSDSDFLPSGSLQSIFTMHANNDGRHLKRSKKMMPTSSSKCLSREFFDSDGLFGGGEIRSKTPSKDDLDAVVLEDIPTLTLPEKQQLSIMVTAPSDCQASASPDLGRDWSPPKTRAAAKTVWEDGSMIDLMKQFENSDETWEDSVQAELKEDPVLWCLSENARAQLQNPGQVVEMLHELQRSINLIDRFIPELTSNLSQADSDSVFVTNVIQELLKRAQEKQLSSRIRNDFSVVNYDLEAQSLYSEEDIQKMVKLIAWVRNNITASAVTDENDAKMASMGAREVQQSLKSILKIQAKETRPRATNTAAPKIPREDSSVPLRHLSA